MKMRVVFKQGRDLNIFRVRETNLKGQWNRYYDADERMYIVNPDSVNYIELSPNDERSGKE